MKKNLALLLFFYTCFFPPAIFAADKTIICTNSACTQDNQSPLFNETNIYPGFLTSKELKVNNTRSDSCRLNFSGKDTKDFNSNLPEEIMISVTSGATVHYSGSLLSLLNSSYHSLGDLNAGTSAPYLFTASFNQGAGNEFQNLATKFDLNFNFECLDEIYPTSTPVPTSTPFLNPTSGIYLNEIMPHPENGNEWVEIYNANSYPVTLVEWKFDDIDGGGKSPISLSTINISGLGYYVFEIGDGYLNNGNDSARLIDNFGNQIDIFSYNSTNTSNSWSKQTDLSWCKTTPSKNATNNLCLGAPTSTPVPVVEGSVQGVTTSNTPDVCSDAIPVGAPTLLSLTPGVNSITLNWSEGVGPLTYYLIAYGTSPGTYQYGNPNIGGPGTKTYTVDSLSPGQTYYFVVRAGNGCSPGPFGNELSGAPSGGVAILPTEIPTGFQPGVLGEQTEKTESQNFVPESIPSPGDLLGETTTCEKKWLPLLFIFMTIINVVVLRAGNKKFITIILVAGISLVGFLTEIIFFKTDCCRISDIFCHYFWLGSFFSFLFPLFYTSVSGE